MPQREEHLVVNESCGEEPVGSTGLSTSRFLLLAVGWLAMLVGVVILCAWVIATVKTRDGSVPDSTSWTEQSRDAAG